MSKAPKEDWRDMVEDGRFHCSIPLPDPPFREGFLPLEVWPGGPDLTVQMLQRTGGRAWLGTGPCG